MKNNMYFKVVLCTLLLCILSSTALCEAKESGLASTKMLSELGLSAQEWYSSKETRAYLVMGMFVDCAETVPDSAVSVLLEATTEDTIYVANAAENEVDVYCFGKDARFVFRYTPMFGLASYEVCEQENAYLHGEKYMEQMVKDKKCSSYKHVPQKEIQKLLQD